MAIVKCSVASRVFGKDDFSILSCITSDEIPEEAIKERSSNGCLFMITGYGLPTTKGSNLEVEGKWTDSKYGMQLKAVSFVETFPANRDAVIAYLVKEVKGVGKATAVKLFAEYGAGIFDALDNDFCGTILSVRKMRKDRLDEAAEDWKLKQASRKVIAKLVRFGITPRRAMDVKKVFGSLAEYIIENDCYQLCNVHGFGFEIVDRIARAQESWNPSSPERIGCAFMHILAQAESDGHLFLTPNSLINGYRNAIGKREGVIDLLRRNGENVSEALVKMRGNEMLLSGELAMTNGMIYLARNKLYEQSTAELLRDLLCVKIPKHDYDIIEALEDMQKCLPYPLANKQRIAIISALSQNITIITGGPGTGKSTTLGVLVDILCTNEPENKLMLAAPTGKAAKKMRDACRAEANTIDYYLCALTGTVELDEDPSYGVVDENDLKFDASYIIIDEMSMISMKKFYRVLTHVSKGCRLILVGDVDQLPSVGAGNVLRELIRCRIINVVILDEIHRQALDSPIIANSQRINKGNTDIVFNEDFQFVEAKNPDDCARLCVDIFTKELDAHDGDLESVAILSPMRKKTNASVWELNRSIRDRICPESGYCLTANGVTFSAGLKVMNLQNVKAPSISTDQLVADISNGDTGIVRRVAESALEVDFGGTTVIMDKDMCDNLTIGYAYTIHKSQGSEMPVVIIPVLKEMKFMWKRNLLYTGITRAKKKVYLVGVRSVIDSAIETVDTSKRNTLLAQRICALFGKARIVEFKTQAIRDAEKEKLEQSEKSQEEKEDADYEQLSFMSAMDSPM